MKHLLRKETASATSINLVGGSVVQPDGTLQSGAVRVRDHVIEWVGPADAPEALASPVDATIHCENLFLMPGMIDIHSDYIEHMAAPRPSTVLNVDMALAETERELIGHGITTMYHSLSIYKKDVFGDRPIRSPENLQRFVNSIERSHHGPRVIHHRFHARFEIDSLDRVEEIRRYIDEGKIHLLSFMDHTPGQGQYRDLEVFRSTVKGYRSISDREINAIIDHHQNKEKMILEDIQALAELARSRGISLASHDDDSTEKVALARDFGTNISEFPITLEVARFARDQGLHRVAGAPNVLLGGSHSGNLSAEEAILDGAVDILCSDYYPAAMLHAVFDLHERRGIPLHQLSALVSTNPARAVGIDSERGSLETGKKADIIGVELVEVPGENGVNQRFPMVRFALVDGVEVYRSAYRRADA